MRGPVQNTSRFPPRRGKLPTGGGFGLSEIGRREIPLGLAALRHLSGDSVLNIGATVVGPTRDFELERDVDE